MYQAQAVASRLDLSAPLCAHVANALSRATRQGRCFFLVIAGGAIASTRIAYRPRRAIIDRNEKDQLIAGAVAKRLTSIRTEAERNVLPCQWKPQRRRRRLDGGLYVTLPLPRDELIALFGRVRAVDDEGFVRKKCALRLAIDEGSRKWRYGMDEHIFVIDYLGALLHPAACAP